jgi:hypothetical protein
MHRDPVLDLPAVGVLGGGDRSARAFRVGVGGPVGTGKTALVAALCRTLGGSLRLGVVTNDIYTTEDARFLRAAGVLDPERILAVETGVLPAHGRTRRHQRQPGGGRGARPAIRTAGPGPGGERR